MTFTDDREEALKIAIKAGQLSGAIQRKDLQSEMALDSDFAPMEAFATNEEADENARAQSHGASAYVVDPPSSS